MNDNDYCVQKAAAPGSSLYYATLFLDAPRQQALIALHAFRREIYDVVRNCLDIEPARAKLAWWRMQVGALYEGHPDHPVTKSLSTALLNFPMAQEQLQEVIDGYEMDLDRGRYEDFKALQLYCYRVSSTISSSSSGVLGYEGRGTARFAHEIGLAMQLIDIIRDAGLDARQGRIYLPLDELQRFGVSEDDLFNARHDDKTRLLLDFQSQRARSLFQNALSLLDAADSKSQRFLLAFATMQIRLLDEIERDGFRVLDRGHSLTPVRKLWTVSRTWLGA